MAQPLAGAPPGLGCSVRADAAPEAIMEALHANGFVVLQLGDLSGPQLSAAFGKLFPSEEVTPIGWFDHQVGVSGIGNLNLARVGGEQFVAMGNVMRDDDSSKPAVDWVPCTDVGVGMRSADGGWSDELEEALQEWREKKTVCEFMEWHTDQLFVPVVPTLTAIYCKTAGGASTAFASGVNGLRTLPPELRAAAEEATVEYHDRSTAQVDQYGKVEAKTLGSGPLHKMVQRHPHTGVEALRFGGLQGIRTIVGMEEEEGQRLAWQIMRHATRDENSYYHPWQAGELIVWDQRLVFHSRVPYDADPTNPREVWRVSFLPDRADWELNRGL